MSTNKTCRTCGTDISANAPFGHCPKCLLDLGFGPLPDDQDAPPPSATGAAQCFGDYELIDQIGRGGMGIVYRARQVALNRPVALKMISAGEFATPMLIQRFRREAEAAANLHHPHIVPIHEIGELKGQYFYSMQLIEGDGLDKHIGPRGFSVDPAATDARVSTRARQEKIARILCQVAWAVDYAHQRGVLHRDLKPSNIILDRDGAPHLTDFGVAKVMSHDASNLTASGAIMGTPSYMAPEQAAGDSKRITVAADIYSLGAVLYTMLTGSPPFRGETPVATLRQVVEQEPKHPSTLVEGIDSDLATIAMKCLEKEPQRRYSSASALAEDLERWTRREPIQARSIGTGERFWRWCRRNPKLAVLGSSVMLLLVFLAVGATVFALHVQSSNDSAEKSNRYLRKQLIEHLVAVYGNPGTLEYDVESEERRELFRQPPARTWGGSRLTLTAAVYVYEHPTNMLETLSPVLLTLEDKLGERLGRQVEIHLRMFRTYDKGYEALESTNLNFGRVGPASYVHLLDRGNNVRLLAMQDHIRPLTLAVFTHTNSAVARLLASQPDISLAELVANRSLAMSHTNSTTGNHVPKWFFARAGVFATNFARIEHLAGQSRVRDAVASARFDLGVGNLDLVENREDLKVIAQREVPADLGLCWVAGRGLDETLNKHLRECLFEIRDPAIFEKFESDVSGFTALSDDALARLRQLIRDAAPFDAVSK